MAGFSRVIAPPLPVSRPPTRGFTLIEVLVVLVIAVVAIGLIAPRFGAVMPGLELKGSARDVASALRYARGRALATRRDVAVVIDVDAATYRIEGAPRDRTRSLGRNISVRLVTGRSELRSESVGSITFFPDGSSTGGQISIISGDRLLKVDVHWLTGKVSIFDA